MGTLSLSEQILQQNARTSICNFDFSLLEILIPLN